MSKLRNIVLAASAMLGVAGFASSAEAQYYQQNPYGYAPQGYYYQQPQYVNPRVSRKQAQLQERFVEKYGYQQPVQPYGYGYQQPRYRQQQQYYYQQAPRQRQYQQQYYQQAPNNYGTSSPGSR
jgi:hypothetical protein